MTRLRFVKPLILGLLLVFPAFSTSYQITVNTSSVSGTHGDIFLQFLPGLMADPASVSITNFSLTPPGALSGSPVTFGAVTGSLDAGNLVLHNGTPPNNYLEGLTFGSSLSLIANFSLPPVLVGAGGSVFELELTNSSGTPILADASGFVAVIAYDNTAEFSAVSTNPNTTIVQVGVPEPALLLPFGLLAFFAVMWIRPAVLRRSKPAAA